MAFNPRKSIVKRHAFVSRFLTKTMGAQKGEEDSRMIPSLSICVICFSISLRFSKGTRYIFRAGMGALSMRSMR